MLIIDDDRRSENGVPPARLTLHHANRAAGDPEQNAGGNPEPEAENPSPPGVTAPRERRPILRVYPRSGDTVLDMDPQLVRDILGRVQEVLAMADGEYEPTLGARDQGGIAIDLPTQTVWRSGRPVRLSPTEFRLLVALVRGRGAVVSRGHLRRDVWPGGTDVQPRVIDTHIARLRRKLEEDPKRPRHILTAVAAGYRFLA